MPVSFCTSADLKLYASEAEIARLARDDNSTSATVDAADVAARLSFLIEQCSGNVRNLLGAPSWLDDIGSDDQMASDIKRWTCLKVINQLYVRKGGNLRYAESVREANTEIENTRQKMLRVGSNPDPQRDSWTSSQDSDTDYAPAAEGGAGDQGSVLSNW